MAIFSRRKSPSKSRSSQRTGETRNAPSISESAPASDARVDAAFERDVLEIGSTFLDFARRKESGIFSTQFWSDKLMDWAMKDEAFKVQFFRFVDTYPALKTPEQIHDHLVDYMTQPGVTPPPGMELMTKAGGMAKGLFTKQMTKQITGMAKKFIAGENAEAAAPVLRDLWKKGLCFSVDLLGEACISPRVADAYRDQYLDLINNLPNLVADFPHNERLETDHIGPIPRVNVSIKITSLYWNVDPIDRKNSIDRLIDRLGPLLVAAQKKNVHINFDIEQFELKDLTIDLFEKCCEKYEFPAGLALQAYLRSGMEDAQRIVDWSRKLGRQIIVRLVKGAYWDYETILAEQRGWPVPVWSRKHHSDANFERMATLFIENIPRSVGEGGTKLALGSHNARSIAATLATVRQNGLPDSALELQMLHGMGDPLKAAAIEMNLRLREYLPVGELLAGMAYFVRRLLENTSNESWLRASFSEGLSTEELLANPLSLDSGINNEEDAGVAMIRNAPEKHALSPSRENIGDGRPFFNEPHRDFSDRHLRDDFAHAIKEARPPSAGFLNESPAEAISAARGAFAEWSKTPLETRAKLLTDVARIIRHRRDELAGMLIRSVGYTWREADADVCDAIDYCEFHARAAIDLFTSRRLGRFIGEINETTHTSRGVALLISPWWHPLSTLSAMCSAALVCGNAAVVAPADEATGIAEELRNILTLAGCPKDVVRFVRSDLDSPTLLYSKDLATVAYVGQRERGLEILQAAGTTQKGQPHIKNIVAELGGKNAVIVDASADLGEAVTAVRDGAFGYAGQSPFACSRAIVVDTAYDSFLDRLIESTKELTIGNPLEPGTAMGPIVSEGHAKVIRNRLEKAKYEGRSRLEMNLPPASQLMPGRTYILPHIFADVAPEAVTAQEEIMGPVLCVIRASSFDEAIEIANDKAIGYALSASVFSRKPSNIEQARRGVRVGMLYINSPANTRRVGRQPVAAPGLSGTVDVMRGAADYLRHFAESRLIAENAMRRGFAPEL